MNWRKTGVVILSVSVCICGLCIAEPDSTNSSRLKEMLERYPKADADGDRILTLSEAKAFRKNKLK